jgi:aspartate/methionine/tyrosine aminotransferase
MSLAPYLEWAKTRPRVRFDLAASGVLPVTTAELVGDARAADLFELTGSNDEGHQGLLERIARRYGVGVDRVATGAGASGANFLVFAALVSPGDRVVIETPVYDPLRGAPRLLGAEIITAPRPSERGFMLDPDAIASAITRGVRLVVLTNPHNPSGALAPAESLRPIGDAARAVGAHVLVDEVYLDAPNDGAAAPPAALLDDVFISTNSLTKMYGLAGLRCGWILAAPDVIARVRRARDVVDGTGVFPAEAISALAFDALDRLAARARAVIQPNLARLRAFMAGQPALSWRPPDAGTVAFPRVVGADSTDALAARLLRDYSTAIVPGRFFGAPNHFRISVGGRSEAFDQGLDAIARALADTPGPSGR